MNRSDSYVLRKIDTEYFLVPFKRTRNGLRIFNFNEIGADLWNSCENFEDSGSLVNYIVDKYGVDIAVVEKFVSQLLGLEIIV